MGVRVIALDLSTVSGAAFDGPRDGAPLFATCTGVKRTGDVFGPTYVQFRDWLVDLIVVHRPTHLVFEAPWAPTGARAPSRYTNVDVVMVLFGLAGIAEEVGARHLGAEAVWKVSVQTVRKHFLGHGRPENPKAAVQHLCRLLGFQVKNEHEADACAIWSYGKSMLDKSFAGRDLPLVGASERRIAAAGS